MPYLSKRGEHKTKEYSDMTFKINVEKLVDEGENKRSENL